MSYPTAYCLFSIFSIHKFNWFMFSLCSWMLLSLCFLLFFMAQMFNWAAFALHVYPLIYVNFIWTYLAWVGVIHYHFCKKTSKTLLIASSMSRKFLAYFTFVGEVCLSYDLSLGSARTSRTKPVRAFQSLAIWVSQSRGTPENKCSNVCMYYY